jgi:hypothetical protein
VALTLITSRAAKKFHTFATTQELPECPRFSSPFD